MINHSPFTSTPGTPVCLKPQPKETKVTRKPNPEVTPERIAKLPKWARDHLEDLERERDTAIEHLNSFTDDQTPSKCFADSYVCTGEKQGPVSKRAYFNAKEQINVMHNGILLTVEFYREDELCLRFHGADRHDDVALVPYCHGAVKLVRKGDLRG